MNQSLDLESRLKPHRGRAPRSESFATRFTCAEVAVIVKAAEAEGKTPREWSRDVLLEAAGRSNNAALFTELVATRMLLVNLIKPLILGEKVSRTWITEAMTMVRKEKHKAAQDVMQQYIQETGKER
jgi:hypothetical protein